MQKIVLFTVLFAQTIYCSAQLEVKINPLGALLSNPDASIEFDIADNMALEPFAGLSYADAYFGSVLFTSNGYTYGVVGKYFFTPVRGFDKMYVGIYGLKGTLKYTGFALRANDIFTNDYETVGGCLGYKWVFNNNIVLDLSTAIGKRVGNRYEQDDNSNLNLDILKAPNSDFMLRLGIGYRFGGGKKE